MEPSNTLTAEAFSATQDAVQAILDAIAADNAMLAAKEAENLPNPAEGLSPEQRAKFMSIFDHLRIRTDLDIVLDEMRRLYGNDMAKRMRAGLGVLAALSFSG